LLLLNKSLVRHVGRAAVVAREGTRTQDLNTVGALLATRVSSEAFARLQADASARLGVLPLSLIQLAGAGTIATIVLSFIFKFVAGNAVYRLARLVSRRRFLLLPVRDQERQKVAWRRLAFSLPSSCLICLFVGLGVAWELGFAPTSEVVAGTAWAIAVGCSSLALSVITAALFVEYSSRAGDLDPNRHWHCSWCGYEVGIDVILGCPECGAGTKGTVTPMPAAKSGLPRLRDLWRERPRWVLGFIALLGVVGCVQWTARQVREVRAATAGPLHIATEWGGVTWIRWDDGTQAVFGQGFFGKDGPVVSKSQFSSEAYRRVAVCAWAQPRGDQEEPTWTFESWASPWFSVGAGREFTGLTGHRVFLGSPGAGGSAGDAWLFPREVVAVEQFGEARLEQDAPPEVVNKVWRAIKDHALSETER